jgi:hypothetical protein
MEDEWIDKNVDLSLLADRVEGFFRQKQFVTATEKSNTEFLVVAKPGSNHGIVEPIRAYVTGQPRHFKVKFEAGSRSNAFVRYGTLTSLLGGGIFASKGLKSQEALERLEREFWIYVDRAVWSLTNGSPEH